MAGISEKRCIPCEGGIEPLKADKIATLLADITPWQLNANQTAIVRQYHFKNYYQVMAFVNAVAWIAHQEYHHPDMTIGYNHCIITYSTHAVGGLTENDFICAAKINQLLAIPQNTIE